MPKRPNNMQKKKNSLFYQMESTPDNADEKESKKKTQKINKYICQNCWGVIVTVQYDEACEGTTSMFLPCLATKGCDGRMVSSMYRVSGIIEITHEWYIPEKLPKDPGMRQHVEMGGLMIREISK